MNIYPNISDWFSISIQLKNTLKFEDKEKYSKMQNKIKITLYKM